MKSTDKLKAVWTDSGRSYERVISNVEKAKELVAELVGSISCSPRMLEFLDSATGASLAVGIGRNHTVVTYQRALDPPYYISLGSPAAKGVTSFYYGNEPTEYLLRNAVSCEQGQNALTLFVKNRSMPTNLTWEKL